MERREKSDMKILSDMKTFKMNKMKRNTKPGGKAIPLHHPNIKTHNQLMSDSLFNIKFIMCMLSLLDSNYFI